VAGLSVLFGLLAGYAGHLEAVAAKVAAAQAYEGAAVANQKAAEASLALEQFKADRSMTDPQRAAVISKIRPYAGQEYILSASSDQESLRFVRVVDAVLAEAGWVRRHSPAQVTTPDGEIGISAAPEDGVRVQIAASRGTDTTLAAKAQALSDALSGEGISASPHLVADELEQTPNWIQVRVGSKPK
jgi:hypothetical protein